MADTHARAVAERARGRAATARSAPTSASRSRPRTRAPTCSAAWRTRRGRTSGRPTCASCRASPRACARCSSPRLEAQAARCAGARCSPAAAASGGARGRRPRPGRGAPAEGRLVRRAALRDRAARRQRALFVVEQGGTIRVVQGRQDARHAVPGRQRQDHARAASRACCRWRSRPTTRPAGCSTSTTPTPTATSGSSSTSARSEDEADPGSARQVLFSSDAEPNHNGGLLLFGPDKLLYIGIGDGGGGGDQHGARGNGQSLGTLLGKILRIDPRPSGSRPYTVPADNPFVEPLGRASRRSTATACATRGGSRSTADRRPGDRRRRPERGRGDRLRAQAAAGAGRTSAGASFEGNDRYAPGEKAPGAIKPVITAAPLRRQLLDHRRRRDPRPGADGLARALRVRRLLPRRAPDRGALERPRAQPDRPQAAGRAAVVVRRGRPRARLRHVARRARSTVSSSDDRRASARPTRAR